MNDEVKPEQLRVWGPTNTDDGDGFHEGQIFLIVDVVEKDNYITCDIFTCNAIFYANIPLRVIKSESRPIST
jgi:hypothetical protein